MKRVICFIDALNYKSFEEHSISKEINYTKLGLGVGYSSNLHYSIFQNKFPDDSHFFTDWNIKNRDHYKTNKFHTLLDRTPPLNIIYRKIVQRIFKRINNIPYSTRSNFEIAGSYLFNTKNPMVFGIKTTIVKNPTLLVVPNEVDSICFVFEELDHIGHEYGPNSIQYKNAALKILDLTKDFMDSNRDTEVVVLSDHGMSSVNAKIDILSLLFEKYGLPGKEYFVYCDSVYLRFWYNNDQIKQKIESYICNIEVIHKLTENERYIYKVKSTSFGDSIFILDKGFVFYPNNFSVSLRGNVLGMHGYLDDSIENIGVFATTQKIDLGDKIEIPDIHTLMGY